MWFQKNENVWMASTQKFKPWEILTLFHTAYFALRGGGWNPPPAAKNSLKECLQIVFYVNLNQASELTQAYSLCMGEIVWYWCSPGWTWTCPPGSCRPSSAPGWVTSSPCSLGRSCTSPQSHRGHLLHWGQLRRQRRRTGWRGWYWFSFWWCHFWKPR